MNRDLTRLALAMLIWGVGEGMFLAFEPLYLEQLGADPLLIGAILGAVGISMTIAHLPAGYLVDRFGPRPLLRAAWCTGTLATLLMALAGSLPVFVAGILLYGLTSYVIVPLNSYVTAAGGKLSAGRAITLVSAAFNTGAILGPMIGGRLGEVIGLQRGFLVGAFLFVLSTLVLFPIHPHRPGGHADGQERPPLRGLLSRQYVQYLLVLFVAMFCMYLPQPLSQNFLVTHRQVSLGDIGLIVSARSLGIVVFNLGLGQLAPRLGFILGQAVVTLGPLLLWQGMGLPWYLSAYFLLGGYQAARGLAYAQGQPWIPRGLLGVGYGLIETVISSAIILAPPLAGLLYAQNPLWIYSVSLGLLAAAMVSTLVFLPKADF